MKVKKIILFLGILFLNKSNAQIEKVEIKSFLDEVISQNDYTITSLEKSISKNSYYHSLLLNKAVRFKAFLDFQEFLVKLYSDNCKNYTYEIKLNNLLIRNKFDQGLKNASFLLEIAKNKEPNFDKKFNDILNNQKKGINSILNFSDNQCNTFSTMLQLRSEGGYYGTNSEKNVLSINYLLNPVDEIFEGQIHEFSSINNAPEEDFYFTIKLPISWIFTSKRDLPDSTTVGFFEAYENLFGASISSSILAKKFISSEEMKSKNISDKDIIDFIYKNDKTLLNIIKIFNLKMGNNKILCSFLNNGENKMILYKSYADMGKVLDNDFLSGQIFEYFGALCIKNGKFINITAGALKINDFNSFDYYSKLFYKIITSIKFKDIKKNTIYLTEVQNMKFINLSINGLDYKFMLDTGASNVVINNIVLSDLISNKTITKENYIGDSFAEIADGSIVNCQNWLIPELKIGNKTIKNLTVSVVDSQDSELLFGMDGLNKLNILKLDLNANEILLNSE